MGEPPTPSSSTLDEPNANDMELAMALYFSISISANDSSRIKNVSSSVARSAKVTIQAGVWFVCFCFLAFRIACKTSGLPLRHQPSAVFRRYKRGEQFGHHSGVFPAHDVPHGSNNQDLVAAFVFRL